MKGKKLLPLATLTLVLFFGCLQQGRQWVQAAGLPYYDEVGSLTEYKNFMRGGYTLTAGASYTLFMEWDEGGTTELYLTGGRYRQLVTVQSGVPFAITVPRSGCYSFETPLTGSEITGLTFSFCQHT